MHKNGRYTKEETFFFGNVIFLSNTYMFPCFSDDIASACLILFVCCSLSWVVPTLCTGLICFVCYGLDVRPNIIRFGLVAYLIVLLRCLDSICAVWLFVDPPTFCFVSLGILCFENPCLVHLPPLVSSRNKGS